jgi:hypothetical protein
MRLCMRLRLPMWSEMSILRVLPVDLMDIFHKTKNNYIHDSKYKIYMPNNIPNRI